MANFLAENFQKLPAEEDLKCLYNRESTLQKIQIKITFSRLQKNKLQIINENYFSLEVAM